MAGFSQRIKRRPPSHPANARVSDVVRVAIRDRGQVFDGIRWSARTGSPWRELPERYGPWETAYTLFRRWQIDGTWAVVPDTSSGRCRSIPRSAEPAGTPPGLAKEGCRHRPDESGGAGGRAGRPRTRPLAWRPDHQDSPGRRRLLHILATVVTAGQRAGAPQFTEVMDRIHVPRIGGGHPRTRPAHVLADRACSSRKIREYLRSRQIPHTIPESAARPAIADAEGRPAAAHPASTASATRPDTKPSAESESAGRHEASRLDTRNSPSATEPPSNSPCQARRCDHISITPRCRSAAALQLAHHARPLRNQPSDSVHDRPRPARDVLHGVARSSARVRARCNPFRSSDRSHRRRRERPPHDRRNRNHPRH